ncbi:hypothetical protein [Massilia sp. LjRoot122]|uniref:hypothetical protein n=1 Tax=Massilia sp. LjRoot122 TaxID=3342257 RepID=UPI003ECF2448
MTIILMRTATAGALAAQADNLPLQPQSAGQILCAGILGNGVARLEEAVRLKIPFVLDNPAQRRNRDMMAQRQQLNERLMAEKAERILLRAYEKAGGSVPDKITLQFRALSAVEHLKQQTLQQGLLVYSQKLLFDASLPLEARLGLFKSMKVDEFEPHSASVALAVGRLPSLPAYTVADLIRSFDHTWRPLSFRLDGGLTSWIETAKPWLVEFPLPSLLASEMARADQFDATGYSENATLGLGFFLLSFDEKRNYFDIVTPYLFATRLRRDQEVPMRYSKYYKLEQQHSVTTSYRQLAELTHGAGRKKLARLEVCSKCGTIFSKDRADLAHPSC